MASKPKQEKDMSTVKNESYVTIPLKNIEVNNKWNVRSSLETGENGPEGEGGFEGLKASIALKGQDTPVVVRPNPNKGHKEFSLVTGFRRVEAIAQIAEKSGNKEPTVKCIVRHLDEKAAREANIRENTARESLSGPDLAHGVHEMLATDPTLTDTTMSQMLGVSQAYVSTLHRICEKLKPNLMKRWREDTLKPDYKTIDKIARMAKELQEDAYTTEVRSKVEKIAGSEKGKNRWLDTCKSRAGEVGTLFGALVRDGHVELTGEDFFSKALPYLVKVKSEATDKQIGAIVACAEKAFQAELERDLAAEAAALEAAENEKKAAKKAAKKSVKSENGAVEEEVPF